MFDKILTVDLEYDFETSSTHNLTEVVPRLLDFFDSYGITATFFVLGSIADRYPLLVKRIAKKHEIASHGYDHVYFDKLTPAEVETQLLRSKRAIERLGVKCRGFRAPYFIAPAGLHALLKKNGYKYDSSFSTFFPGRYMHFFNKSRPYWKRGVLELPVPDWLWKFFPSGLSYYRFFYPLSRLFSTPYMVYLHPCEFLDAQPKNRINWLVRNVYRRNQAKSWKIFTRFVKDSRCNFISCDEFVKKYVV